MPLSKEDVERIAELGQLELNPDEVRAFTLQLDSILSHVQKLNELDTSGVEPMSHSGASSGEASYAMRDDVVGTCLGQETALENAPDPANGCFRVPRVIGN